jgi:hypothetical protein
LGSRFRALCAMGCKTTSDSAFCDGFKFGCKADAYLSSPKVSQKSLVISQNSGSTTLPPPTHTHPSLPYDIVYGKSPVRFEKRVYLSKPALNLLKTWFSREKPAKMSSKPDFC